MAKKTQILTRWQEEFKLTKEYEMINSIDPRLTSKLLNTIKTKLDVIDIIHYIKHKQSGRVNQQNII